VTTVLDPRIDLALRAARHRVATDLSDSVRQPVMQFCFELIDYILTDRHRPQHPGAAQRPLTTNRFGWRSLRYPNHTILNLFFWLANECNKERFNLWTWGEAQTIGELILIGLIIPTLDDRNAIWQLQLDRLELCSFALAE